MLCLLLAAHAAAAPAVKTEKKSGLEFVKLPGGSFHFGCEPQDALCFDDEKPGKTVTVKPFWLSRFDVTVAAFARCADKGICDQTLSSQDNGSMHQCNWKNLRGGHPMNCVNWNEAHTFCEWIGGRLPTAEEWEYAAKGGESRVFPWGDEKPDGTRANFCDKNCPSALDPSNRQSFEQHFWIAVDQDDGWAATSPVDNYPNGKSKHGLFDMAGNVWQWVDTERENGDKDVRGGAWDKVSPNMLRASDRNSFPPKLRNADIGFRCAMDKL